MLNAAIFTLTRSDQRPGAGGCPGPNSGSQVPSGPGGSTVLQLSRDESTDWPSNASSPGANSHPVWQRVTSRGVVCEGGTA